MQKENTTDWYASWFNTPYYHILYKDRGHVEAKAFMRRLVKFLGLKENDSILDLACGKGRHAISLNEMGYNVTGVDLSPESIAYAKQFETDTLKFEVHDMCLPFPKKFNAVFNLFTSFGYFENDEDNLRTIKAIKQELKSDGYGVIDFMNVSKVINNLVPEEQKKVEGIVFNIKRFVDDGSIFKEIKFEYNGIPFSFTERVKILTLNNFKNYFDAAGLRLKQVFGDYQLEPFDEKISERLIVIFN